MSFSFRPAARENVGLLIALAGASGSGKTFSALRIAEGMAPNGRIFFLDTEARRGLHYADRFSFRHADMRPPFRPDRFVQGIQAAEKEGAEVVILDSFSHEYDGEGGILDWAAELEGSGTKPPGNWKEPKLGHKRLMNALLQIRCHLIFCLRADEKIAIEKKEMEGSNGRTFMKTVVTPLGWMPICEKRFMFEMTASFTLAPDTPGLPRYDLPHKVQEQHRAFFPEGQQIGEEAGRALREWAAGEQTAPAAQGQEQLAQATRTKTQAAADDMVSAFDACTSAQEVMQTIDRARRGLDMLRERDEASFQRADAARAAAYQRHVRPPETAHA